MRSFVSTALLLLCSVAHSYNVIYDGSGNVTAIGNLDIDGVLYNVDFDTGIYGTFGGDEYFWADSGADIAAISISVNGVLNAEGAISVAGSPSSYGILSETCSPFGCEFPVTFLNYYNTDIPEWRIQSGPVPEFDDGLRTAWSVAVPLPAAAWLFGSALAGLGWLRRRQVA